MSKRPAPMRKWHIDMDEAARVRREVKAALSHNFTAASDFQFVAMDVAAMIRKDQDFAPDAVAYTLECAARSVARANRIAMQARRDMYVRLKPRKVRHA